MATIDFPTQIKMMAGWLESAKAWNRPDLIACLHTQIALVHTQMASMAKPSTVKTDDEGIIEILDDSPSISQLPPSPKRKAKHDIIQLVALHKNGLMKSDEPCYIMSNGRREDYIIRFENGTVRFYCPRDGSVMKSPTAVSRHHSSQIYKDHPHPTDPGNGWKHIKLSNHQNKSLAVFCADK